jgi:hypothetical protein
MVGQNDRRKNQMIGSRTILTLLMASALAVVGGPGGAAGASLAYAAEDGLNACGCRPSTAGLCTCEKKSRCGCPGECEPKGCEERRAKQMEKEIQAETRKAEAAEAGRRQHPRSDDTDQGPEPPQTTVRETKPPAPRRTVKMTATQKRDLARLIGAYLAEHPDQGDRAIDQVRAEVSRK